MTTQSCTLSKVSLLRILTWIVGHGTLLIVIYTLFKMSLLLMVTARLEEDHITTTTPTTPVSKEDGESHIFFGVNISHARFTFNHAIFVFLIASILNLPQLYAGLKLIQATNLRSSPKKSIALAFLYQRIQFIVTAVELLLFSLVLNLVHDDAWNDKARHVWHIVMQNIFCKLIFIFTVGTFIDELLKVVCEDEIVVMVPSPPLFTLTNRVPIWKPDECFSIDVPSPATDQDPVVIV